MSSPLSYARALSEVEPVVAHQIVYKDEPSTVNINHELIIPSAVRVEVRDSGLFQNRDGKTNVVVSEVDFDDNGRPLTELIVNGDKDERSIRQWYYDLASDDYESRLETDKGTAVVNARRELSSNVLHFDMPGQDIILTRYISEDGGIVLEIRDDKDQLVERATHDDSGLLQRLEYAGSSELVTVTFDYDAHGRLIRQEANPGTGTTFVDGSPVNHPNVREYEYQSSGVVKIRGESLNSTGVFGDGLTNFDEARTYDEWGRPIEIQSVQGVYDLGQYALAVFIEYPEPITQ